MVESLMQDERKSHFCIAFCDLDDFKRVNDTYGHDAGDEVLKHMTKLIVKDLNDCDICRWGGEEIVILMRNCDLATARERMERIRKRIESNPKMQYPFFTFLKKSFSTPKIPCFQGIFSFGKGFSYFETVKRALK